MCLRKFQDNFEELQKLKNMISLSLNAILIHQLYKRFLVYIYDIHFAKFMKNVLVTISNIFVLNPSLIDMVLQHELKIDTVAILSLQILLDLWMALITRKRTSNYIIYSQYLKLSFENKICPLTTITSKK